ncbi:MAG: ATP-binding protein [Muribaculaceae bacterium]|nr:ATP-binding protein [Muribaculaceae bacterium]
MEEKYINQFYILRLWDRIDISWSDIYDDVNIIVGINGSGKTTLLNIIDDYYNGVRLKKNLAQSVEGNPVSSPVTYIRSFDVPANSRKKTESILLQTLKNIINQNGEGTSFFDYRMKQMNYPSMSQVIQARIERFFHLIDSMFSQTGKYVGIDPETNTLVFYISKDDACQKDHKYKSKRYVTLDQLSSGEKQLLLILTTVFLQEEKPNVLLMDEPEISLHIEWQDRLVSILRELNPNCQLILTTHSPNIFASGWEDRIVFMEDLISETKHEC